MVDPRDLYLVNELADQCMVNRDCVVQAARELGKQATRAAVCRRALELRGEAAKRPGKRWR